MPARLLVVDDDARIRALLRRGLEPEGYLVDEAADGESALAAAARLRPDLVVLDLLLPGIDGVEVCRRLRDRSDVPVLMLTARGEVSERVAGLREGADDYLVKPFAFEELLARIEALLRRRGAETAGPLRFAGVELDPRTREVLRDGRSLELTPQEFQLLELFLRHPRQVLTRRTLWERVWGADLDETSNALEVYVGYLRRKLGEPRLIHTVRGVGYALRAP